MNILITGAEGFIGKNLITHLKEIDDLNLLTFTKENQLSELASLVKQADFIFHLAGVNRPENESEFYEGNSDLTKFLCDCIAEQGRAIPVVMSSSIQASNESIYGKSKKLAEDALISLHNKTGNPIAIYRLPNVFGKWCKPNYNSVVATFCYNIIHDLPITVNNPEAPLQLVYIDDVIATFLKKMNLLLDNANHEVYCEVPITYQTTVGELASILKDFHQQRENLYTDNVGVGFKRALYATYISYLPKNEFSYSVKKHEDPRGRFVEMLKTPTSGQFSYFTAHPGVTRGGHYHHSKTEKFLVIKGKALFKFRNIITNEYYELITTGDNPQVVDTATGWTHDITNIGDDEMIVMLWANEIFDPNNPDTYASPLNIEGQIQ